MSTDLPKRMLYMLEGIRNDVMKTEKEMSQIQTRFLHEQHNFIY